MRFLRLMCLLCLTVSLLRGQKAEPGGNRNPTVPTITYDRLWEAFTPQNVNITVQSDGTTKYVSRNPLKPKAEQEADPEYMLQFTMSKQNREKLFRQARDADYFHGDFKFTKHAVSSTGKKTLTYADQSQHFETTYDYSENKDIEEITNLFQGISNTLEHGRKLVFLRRFDRLGLESELKGMESAAESHSLEELQVIAPLLEEIVKDPAILNIARQRAKRLLAKCACK